MLLRLLSCQYQDTPTIWERVNEKNNRLTRRLNINKLQLLRLETMQDKQHLLLDKIRESDRNTKHNFGWSTHRRYIGRMSTTIHTMLRC
jgi:hypothetical protein